MGIGDNYFFVKVTDKVVVHAEEPWNDHWLSFTNLDLLVPPFDVGSFFCYKKPSHGSFPDLLNTLKASLSRALSLYYPLAGEILWNPAAEENQFRCNNRGIDFIEAVADVELKELNLYNPDESIEGKLMPKKLHGVLAIQGEQLNKLQLVASENGQRRSKLEAFTSFLWKIVALSMEDSGNHNKLCNVALAVDGRRRLSEGDGEEKEKLMASHFGNVLSMPSGSKTSQELMEMSLSTIATDVHEFLQTATTKDHFLDLIDWVEERRSQPLVAIAFASKEMSVMVSSGTRFHTNGDMDFGWGKVVFGSCHVPSGREDCYVSTLPSPTNNNDWVIYMHLPMKHMNYIESHAGHMFKPLDSDYLEI
ncbi:hypothetical protein L1987_57262 [Smallanthus sonchifolius]|uniref:Uncharacterized protein n=1 Tax=Smallanthus sonchifolius TaxID=185202 RepID=A0ACB9DCJ7_9ASTR|nr:hypothetical protein L1987_57262 [Smallanthus sonchifolius]